MCRFGGNGTGTVYERLAALRQTGEVEEYVQEFELLVAQARPNIEDQLLGYFSAGLHLEIRSQVQPHDPQDLTRATEVARDVEEALKVVCGYEISQRKEINSGFRYQGSRGIVSRTKCFGGNSNAQTSSNGNRITSRSSGAKSVGNVYQESRNRGVRTLPYAEYTKRRNEGRCYHCGLAYSPGHRCPEKSLRIVILAEDEQINDEGEITLLEREKGTEEGKRAIEEVECAMARETTGGSHLGRHLLYQKLVSRLQP